MISQVSIEQILLNALVVKEEKTVSTVVDHLIKDNGYSYDEFCNFYTFNKKPLMHIIGDAKQNKLVCELLGRTLLANYPEYYGLAHSRRTGM